MMPLIGYYKLCGPNNRDKGRSPVKSIVFIMKVKISLYPGSQKKFLLKVDRFYAGRSLLCQVLYIFHLADQLVAPLCLCIWTQRSRKLRKLETSNFKRIFI